MLILTAIFNVSLLVLLAGAAWFLHKMNEHLGKLWIHYELSAKEQADTNAKLDELLALMKLTFNKEFATKIEDVIKIKEEIPQTVKVLCDDGEIHDLAIDGEF